MNEENHIMRNPVAKAAKQFAKGAGSHQKTNKQRRLKEAAKHRLRLKEEQALALPVSQPSKNES